LMIIAFGKLPCCFTCAMLSGQVTFGWRIRGAMPI